MIILMYHAVGRPGERPSRFVVPPRRFERQMALLKWLRYRVVPLEHYVAGCCDGRPAPSRAVAITFDDGYADNWSAHPILRRYGYPATIFLVVDKVGGANDWDHDTVLAGRPLLSWGDVRALQAGGVQFGAHTRTHPRLSSLSEDQVRGEIVGSQEQLSRKIGRPVPLFSYPYGDSSPAAQRIVFQAGFLGSCGTRHGRNGPYELPYDLRRTEIRGTDTLVTFVRKLQAGDDGCTTS